MKTALYDISGKKKSDIDLPPVFNASIREDIVAKSFEAEKFALMQPYSHAPEAGKRHSASGTISHRRHEWKGHYGKGISRTPRKTMWRRGTQFFWIGAEVSHTRGGRAAHGPTGLSRERKINKKEMQIAMTSAVASTTNENYVKKRYSNIKDAPTATVIESLPKKSKDLISALKNIFGNAFSIVMKNKDVRAGKGKRRGRKYKSNAGLLIITGKEEKLPSKGIDIKPLNALLISDLYPLGRLALYTKKALEELGERK